MTNHTVFTDYNTATGSGTTIVSAWLNDIDTAVFNVTTTASPLDISHHAAASKITPVDNDEIAIGDSAQNFSFARLTFANIRAQLFTLFGAQLNAATGKTTPVDADSLPLQDSAASNATKQVTWANLKATVRTYIASLLNMTGAVNEAITSVASVTTPDIWTGQGNIINYTGIATATGFAAAPQAGTRRVLYCSGACAFTAGPTMLIDGVASGNTLTVAGGDRVEVLAFSTTQFVLRHLRVDALTDAVVTNAGDPTHANASDAQFPTVSWVRNAMSAIATAAGFASSFGTSGYVKLPSWLGGLVIQWGTALSPGTAGVSVTFPLAFPTAFRSGSVVGNTGTGTSPATFSITGTSTTGMTIVSSGSSPVFYIVIGN